jgi:hypothetical protein
LPDEAEVVPALEAAFLASQAGRPGRARDAVWRGGGRGHAVQKLSSQGWKVRYGTTGETGSFTDVANNTIVINWAYQNDPVQATRSLSHEVGHDLNPSTPIAFSGLTHAEYIAKNTDAALAGEGAATLYNTGVRAELLANGQPEPPNSVTGPAPTAPKPPAQPPLVNPTTPKEGQRLMPQNPSATAFQLIDAIAALPDLNKAALEGVTGVVLAHSPTAGPADLYYEAMFPSGPFQRLEVRQSNPSQPKFALVFLAARPGTGTRAVLKPRCGRHVKGSVCSRCTDS